MVCLNLVKNHLLRHTFLRYCIHEYQGVFTLTTTLTNYFTDAKISLNANHLRSKSKCHTPNSKNSKPTYTLI